jgi:hypothetical protein
VHITDDLATAVRDLSLNGRDLGPAADLFDGRPGLPGDDVHHLGGLRSGKHLDAADMVAMGEHRPGSGRVDVHALARRNLDM